MNLKSFCDKSTLGKSIDNSCLCFDALIKAGTQIRDFNSWEKTYILTATGYYNYPYILLEIRQNRLFDIAINIETNSAETDMDQALKKYGVYDNGIISISLKKGEIKLDNGFSFLSETKQILLNQKTKQLDNPIVEYYSLLYQTPNKQYRINSDPFENKSEVFYPSNLTSLPYWHDEFIEVPFIDIGNMTISEITKKINVYTTFS
jgi:hypothetical protein